MKKEGNEFNVSGNTEDSILPFLDSSYWFPFSRLSPPVPFSWASKRQTLLDRSLHPASQWFPSPSVKAHCPEHSIQSLGALPGLQLSLVSCHSASGTQHSRHPEIFAFFSEKAVSCLSAFVTVMHHPGSSFPP